MADLSVVTLADIAAGAPAAADVLVARANSLVELEAGLYLGRTDMPLGEGLTYRAETFPFAALSVLLAGRISTPAAGLDELRPDGMLVIANNERRDVESTFYGADRLQNVEVFVTPAWFASEGGHFRDDPDFDPIRAAFERPTSNDRLPLDARLQHLAHRILALRETGPLAAMRLEAWSLDLFAELTAAFHRVPAKPAMSPSDRERVAAVREFLERDAGAAGTLTDIAARHGVSASKLKRDFFQAYGTCVGGFANEQKLALARRLLEQGLSVSQTAYRVGYSHPANFSAAFKRRFGLSPRTLRG